MAADEDPFIWLEEVEGSAALAWAEQQNNLSIPRLQGDPRFTEIRAEIEAILTSDDRIPSGSLVDGSVYNFWQDADHVRGILRNEIRVSEIRVSVKIQYCIFTLTLIFSTVFLH